MVEIYKWAYFDNKIVSIDDAHVSVASSAVLYGLSVYTVFPLIRRDGCISAFRTVDHYNRLVNSSKIIGIDTFEPAWNYERFVNAITDLARTNSLEEHSFVRATVHVSELLPGTISQGLETKLSMFAYKARPILPQSGARLKTSVWRRVSDNAIPSRAKVNGAYINSVLGKQDAINSGYDDCLFLDSMGHVCELSAANIFIVRDGVLITPDRGSDILEGINRKTILEISKRLGIPVIERTVDFTELYIADEIFACGTSAGIAPVIEIDARKVRRGGMGPITKTIKEAFDYIFEKYEASYDILFTPIHDVS